MPATLIIQVNATSVKARFKQLCAQRDHLQTLKDAKQVEQWRVSIADAAIKDYIALYGFPRTLTPEQFLERLGDDLSLTFIGAATPMTVQCVEKLANENYFFIINRGLLYRQITALLPLATAFIYGAEAQVLFEKTGYWPALDTLVLQQKQRDLEEVLGMHDPQRFTFDNYTPLQDFVNAVMAADMPESSESEDDEKNALPPAEMTAGSPTSADSSTDTSESVTPDFSGA